MSGAPNETESYNLRQQVLCAHCGYDLRGLPGDPVRCPECGETTPVSSASDLAADAEASRLAWAQARVKTGASLCAIATGATICLLALYSAFPRESYSIRMPPLLVCVVIWLVGAAVYAFHCAGTDHWIRAFLHHQVHSVIAVVGNIVLIFGTFLVFGLLAAVIEAAPCVLLLAIIIAAAIVIVLRPMRWFDRQAVDALQEQIAAFQREAKDRT